MKQTDTLNYECTDDEEVEVRVVPHGANSTVTIAFSGKETKETPSPDGLRYKFKLLKSNGTPQILIIRGDFMGNDAPNAKFVVTFDPDGKRFDGGEIPRPTVGSFAKNEYFFALV